MEIGKAEILDELLVLQFQSGEKAALELLYRKWNRRLIQRAYLQVGDLNVAKDITQDVWVLIMKSIHKLKKPSKFASWALTITYRKSIDHIRGKQRERKDSAAMPLQPVEDMQEDYNATAIQRLHIALGKMDADQKSILTLFYLDGQPVKEIARILMVPVGTVKSRLFTAREKLKSIINEPEKIK